MELRFDFRNIREICDKINESNCLEANQLALVERALYTYCLTDTVISESIGITENDLCLKYQKFYKR